MVFHIATIANKKCNNHFSFPANKLTANCLYRLYKYVRISSCYTGFMNNFFMMPREMRIILC